MKKIAQDSEKLRLEENRNKNGIWKKWGPYLSERQWGTVREDYSSDSQPWEYSTYSDAMYKAYRWGEDGIGGMSDIKQNLCIAFAFWNEKDLHIKERLFGLTGPEGNHGEDVKEYYYYIDNTPTHSYMKFLYKYPQEEFPYEKLVLNNTAIGKESSEYELLDTGVFDDDRYFDIFIDYAKNTPEDILIRVEVFNRGNDKANLHVIPEVWFRNTWAWKDNKSKPEIKLKEKNRFDIIHKDLGEMYFYFNKDGKELFTDNEINHEKLYSTKKEYRYTKDGINDYIVNQNKSSVNGEKSGTKAAIDFNFEIDGKSKKSFEFRLTDKKLETPFDLEFKKIFLQRKKEADKFYDIFNFENEHLESRESKKISRQALAGLLWSKQYYNYFVDEWLDGDPLQPSPPEERKYGRNKDWRHLYADHIISMPDKWEYPWFAAWDLAFHAIPFALIDPDFAKDQLELLTRPEYMHPNGQIPAYEWNFSDVNPPVHAWATLKVYEIDKKNTGIGDNKFLEKIFQKLLLNFTWWVNRKDREGNNIFQGGFLGLDNIGVFDRSAPLPKNGYIEQADGSAWMAMYCLNMFKISLILAEENSNYEDMAIKFFEHFLFIADSINNISGSGLWDDEDKFFYDKLHIPNEYSATLKVKSMVGIIPLFAVQSIDEKILDKFPKLKKRIDWYSENKPHLARHIAPTNDLNIKGHRLFSIVDSQKLRDIMAKVLDSEEFLSEYGIRALSKYHKHHPYKLNLEGDDYSVEYIHGESDSDLFGGNSNWRGPIWFPLNYLLIETLQNFNNYYGDQFKIEFPTNSGKSMNLDKVSNEISKRLIKIFIRNKVSVESDFTDRKLLKRIEHDPHWSRYLMFNEYFDGDNGRGLGANHQTGWTAIIAKLIHDLAENKL